jgi:fatty-acyl-CoA synthase
MPLDELLPKALKLFPKREAVVCGSLRMDYASFAERVWRLANGLESLGLERNDRVAILHENCHVFLEAYFAAAHLGLILVPLNYRLSARELAMILNDSGSKALIAQSKFRTRSMICPSFRANPAVSYGRREPEGLQGMEYETLLRGQAPNPPGGSGSPG